MKNILAPLLFAATASMASANQIAEVDTAFQLFGPNHKVVIERFDDPAVENASCYVSYAKSGGIGGALGFSEDPSRFSIACRATGPVKIINNIPSEMTEVFNRSTSILFKEMRVSRMLDKEKNVLVYLVWSTELINGSPFNSITAIAINEGTK